MKVRCKLCGETIETSPQAIRSPSYSGFLVIHMFDRHTKEIGELLAKSFEVVA